MRSSTWGRRARTASASVLVLVALVACSSGSSDDGAASATPSGPASAAAGAAATVASASPGASVAPLPVLASRAGHATNGPIQVDINAVVVEPKFTRVTFTLWNKDELGGTSWQIFELLSDGVSQMTSSGSSTFQDAWTVDGVYLLDTVNAKRYLPARTANGACVCSDNLRNLVHPQEGVALWSLFQALPAGVDTIDISVPKVGLFEKVPVTR